MSNNEMADLIAEVLAVDTENGFAKDVIAKDDTVCFVSKDGESFVITVNKK